MVTGTVLEASGSSIAGTLRSIAKTWDLGWDIIKDKALWSLATKLGAGFVTYLKALRAMRAGFASGNFVYGLFIGRLPASVTPLAMIF
jgi:hypothetical protein